MKRLPQAIRVGGWLAVAFHLPPIGLHAICITGRGGWSLAGVELFLLPAVGCLVVGICSLPLAVWPRARRAALSTAAACGIVVALWPPAVYLQSTLRRYGFRLAAKRAVPLVNAINRYSSDNGAPPATLSALVPKYLSEVPAGLPPIELISGEKLKDHFYGFHGNPWALHAVVSTGVLNWDQFLYLPLQNYPEEDYGGWLERIGDWAYVHE